MIKRLFIFSAFLTIVLVIVGIAFYRSNDLRTNETDAGGFGISPPHFKTGEIEPGASYQDQIYALRSTTEGTEKVSVKINAPDIESWLSLYPGNELVFNEGDTQVPVLVKAKIPEKAGPGEYKGSIYFYYNKPNSNLFKKGNQVVLGAVAEILIQVKGKEVKIIKDLIQPGTDAEYAVKNDLLYQKWKGHFISIPGEPKLIYYVSPSEKVIYNVSTTTQVINLLPKIGTGISNANLDKIQIATVFNSEIDSDKDGLPDFFEQIIGTDPADTDTDNDKYSDKEELDKNYDPLKKRKPKTIDQDLSEKLSGKILLQVENRGTSWYISPVDTKRYFLGTGDYAFNLVNSLALQIGPEEITKLINNE